LKIVLTHISREKYFLDGYNSFYYELIVDGTPLFCALDVKSLLCVFNGKCRGEGWDGRFTGFTHLKV